MADSNKSVSILVHLINKFSPVAKQITGDIKGIKTETNTVGTQVAGIVGRINTAAAGLRTTLAGLGVAASIGGVIAGFKAAINDLDELKKTGEQFGVDVRELSKLKFGANLSGLGQNQFVTGLRTFAEVVTQAKEAGSQGDIIFQALGVSVVDAEGKLRGIDELLPEVADSLLDVADGVDKTALAADLFGSRSGLGFLNFLGQGSEGLRKFGEDAERAGLVFSNEEAAKAERFNDSLTVLAETTKGQLFRALEDVLGPLDKFVESLGIGIQYVGSLAKQFVQFVGLVGGGAIDLLAGNSLDDVIARSREKVAKISETQRLRDELIGNPEETLKQARAEAERTKAEAERAATEKKTVTELFRIVNERIAARKKEQAAFEALQKEEAAEQKRAEAEKLKVIEDGRAKIAAAREADLEQSIEGLRTLEAEQIRAIEEESARVGRSAEEKQQLILLVEQETADKIKEINQQTFEEILAFQRARIEGNIALVEQASAATLRALRAEQDSLPQNDVEGRFALERQILEEEFNLRQKVLAKRLEEAELDERAAKSAEERFKAQSAQVLIQNDLVELTREQADAVEALGREYERARIESNEFLVQFEDGVTSAGESLTKNLLEGFRKGTLDAKAAFMDFLESIISGIEDLLAQAIIQDFKNLLFGGGTSGEPGQGLFTGGGLFKGLFSGGGAAASAPADITPLPPNPGGGAFDAFGGIPLAPETEGMFDKFLGGMGKILGVSPSGTATAGTSGFLGGLGGLFAGFGLGAGVGTAAGGNAGGATIGAALGGILGLLLLPILGPLAPFLGGLLGGTAGGFFSEGGPVAGGGGRRGVGDKVLARVDPREWIIRPEAVAHYGQNFMAMVNDMIFPKDIIGRMHSVPTIFPVHGFAAGGPAGGGNSGGEPVIQPVLVAGDDAIYKLMTSGKRGYQRFLRDHGFAR